MNSMHTELTDRYKFILKEVIKGYIVSGEPIGSRTISRNKEVDLSPASIRNVMSDLEELGYIEQIHTSSGRVPTNKGYRFYVNDLMDIIQLGRDDIEKIEGSYNGELVDIEGFLDYTSRVLSDISSYAGVVLLHKEKDRILKHIKFIKLSSTRALAVFLWEEDILQQRVIELYDNTSQDQLDIISKYINNRLTHASLKQIKEELIVLIREDKERYDRIFNKVIVAMEDIFVKNNKDDIDRLYVGGSSNIFNHIEFISDIRKMQTIFKAFEEKNMLVGLLDKCLNREGVDIIIGPEVNINEMSECSIVTHRFKKDENVLGVLGIIGPKRMEYSKVMALVNYTASVVSRILSEGNESK